MFAEVHKGVDESQDERSELNTRDLASVVLDTHKTVGDTCIRLQIMC